MGVLADWQIRSEGIIDPCLNAQKATGIITYGLSSYGYDLRAASTYEVFSPARAQGGIIDPKAFDPTFLEQKKDVKSVIIPANSFVLTHTMETVRVPRSCIGIVIGKSTYARCGLVVNCTPLEPEWRGTVTIELSNTAPMPMRIYSGEGIAQVFFIRADGMSLALRDAVLEAFKSGPACLYDDLFAERLKMFLCEVSYSDKNGRYQDQGDSATLPCVRTDENRTSDTPG